MYAFIVSCLVGSFHCALFVFVFEVVEFLDILNNEPTVSQNKHSLFFYLSYRATVCPLSDMM